MVGAVSNEGQRPTEQVLEARQRDRMLHALECANLHPFWGNFSNGGLITLTIIWRRENSQR